MFVKGATGILVNISSGGGLPLVQCQAITWTKMQPISSTGSLGTNFSEIWMKIRQKNSFWLNVFENIICKMEAILAKPQQDDLFKVI